MIVGLFTFALYFTCDASGRSGGQIPPGAIKEHKTPEEAIKWVLPGDLSRHPWGLALDVNLHHEKSGASWLEANGATFGLCRVYENEWWHFEPLTAPGGICPPLLPDASHLK